MRAQALTIAGSDSGGGAGIQADLKTFSALGVYGASVITAITAQNTRTVAAVDPVSPKMITAQIDAVLSDLRIGAIKIGMLGDVATIDAVAKALDEWRGPVVLDPVMVAKSGDALLADSAVAALRDRMLPRATVLTPNLPEAARLLDCDAATNENEMIRQGVALRALGPKAVLMKGGHGEGPVCTDLLITAHDPVRLTAPRQTTRNTHGTGCTLSAAVAAGLALGLDLSKAVTRAHAYLQGAIAKADALDVGHGHGPVHHFHGIWAND
ncbi:MAG: bifunctional hydroxymethylpyrimidine kinase/phosphomethylpyrimidine kinase [Rhodobacteraceae bacterium]|nr:bifunctional hydroxymethylpyrimidine kinase/phosphomethylpyrimidine kinase [Paracoccaceae bacterium]